MRRIIKYSDAQRIIDIACPKWKEDLFIVWGERIVLKKEIEISNGFYQKMREACTSEQHLLFDEIFGQNKPKFKIGDWVIGWHATNSTYQDNAWQIVDILNDEYFVPKNNLGHNCSAKWLRLATDEEIKTANTFPDGTPCLVTDYGNASWTLRYADGKGQFYTDGKKSGKTNSWKHSIKLDMNNLPINE